MKRLALALALTLGALSAVEIASPGSIVSQAQAATIYTATLVGAGGGVIASNNYSTFEAAAAKCAEWNTTYVSSHPGSSTYVEIREGGGGGKEAN